MKIITGNLLKFAALLAIVTIGFRFGLSYMLENEHFTGVWLLIPIYAIPIFIFGWAFGKKDNESLPLHDIGLRFHLTTYIICCLIAELWFFLGFHSGYENVRSAHYMVLFWGIGVVIHVILYLVTRKDAIKGLKKDEIFD